MLPDYETCRNHVNAYIKKHANRKLNAVTFKQFRKYKTDLESAGQSILDENNIRGTASLLRDFLITCRMRLTGVAETEKIEQILRDIQPYYKMISNVSLGEGLIQSYRCELEAVYKRLGGITNNANHHDNESSIVGKSEALMAVWGQVPGFDSLIRTRFEKWTHSPAPEKLPFLSIEEIWYSPSQFSAMIEELDNWVLAWPRNNDGKSFVSSFSDSCPGIPVGRLIDIIYHWKLPDPWVDYRLQSQGS